MIYFVTETMKTATMHIFYKTKGEKMHYHGESSKLKGNIIYEYIILM